MTIDSSRPDAVSIQLSDDLRENLADLRGRSLRVVAEALGFVGYPWLMSSVETNSWIEPIMLMEFDAGGQKVRLCDFGSAGEGGTPYRSWLSVKNVLRTRFSRSNPLRSVRP